MKDIRQKSEKGRAEAALELGDVLGFMQLLWALSHQLEAASKRMRSAIGVTGPQRLVLRIVGRSARISPGALSEVLHVHPSSLTGVLRRLEAAGLLHRERDAADGRRAVLTLTRRGRALNARASGTVEASVKRAMRASSGAKVRAASDLLRAIANEVELDFANDRTL